MNLPEAFENQMQALLSAHFSAFKDSLNTTPNVSIHLNPLKQFKWKENCEGVKWYNKGVYLKERPVFTLDPAFHAGAYYVQEASSMFLAAACQQLVDLGKPLKILDLCAAPGGKSTLLTSIMHPESLLLANEVIRSRYSILKYNLAKWGYANTHSTCLDSKNIANLSNYFDLVVVDAPCSGEGLFRKDKKAIQEWSASNVQHCAARQKRILANAIKALKPGGALIYSTCTYNDSENCANAEWITKEFPLAYHPLNIPSDWSIVDRQPGYQFFPHLTRGEGFYIACFIKEEAVQGTKRVKTVKKPIFPAISKKDYHLVAPWLKQVEALQLFYTPDAQIAILPKNQIDHCVEIHQKLGKAEFGTLIGAIKKGQFVPAPTFALSNCLSESVPQISLSRRDALGYLRRDAIQLPAMPAGWALIRYENLGLGWIKGLKNRFNNYYPKEWRIRMEIK